MQYRNLSVALLGGAAVALALCAPVHALPVITNGGFESSGGWSFGDQVGSDGGFSIQSGTSSPSNGDTVPAPPEGSKAAMSDGVAGGSHALFQDIAIDVSAASYTLTLDLFIGNRSFSGDFFTPTDGSLDFSINDFNQQFRIDLVTNSADLFSIAPGDILASLYQTQSGDPLVSGYTALSFDVTSILNANVGGTVRLRFVEVDNSGPLQVGVDNVRLVAGNNEVPEPSSLAMLLAGLVTAQRRWRRRV